MQGVIKMQDEIRYGNWIVGDNKIIKKARELLLITKKIFNYLLQM